MSRLWFKNTNRWNKKNEDMNIYNKYENLNKDIEGAKK